MKKEVSIKKLDQATDLLVLLERLIKGVSEGEGNIDDIPWSGILLILKRSRKLIQSSSEEMLVSLCAEALPLDKEPASSLASSANGKDRSALSGRIRKIPAYR